jgi:hypothetical protein
MWLPLSMLSAEGNAGFVLERQPHMPILDWLNRDAAFRFVQLKFSSIAIPGRQLASGRNRAAVHLHYNRTLGKPRPDRFNVWRLAALRPVRTICQQTGLQMYGKACLFGAARLKAQSSGFKRVSDELAGRSIRA